jgi:tetratricopeptide (TPR) repeat protein
MKKITVLLSLGLLAGLASPPNIARAAGEFGISPAVLAPSASPHPVPAAAAQKQPQWKSRAEYDAFEAFVKEKDPNKRLSLIQAFLQKYPDTDFKANAYVAEMQTYVQLNQTDEAIQSAKNTLKVDPDNLDALSYLSFTFPYTYKASGSDGQTQLSQAGSNANHGLQLLQNLQKPAGVNEDQFNTYIKAKRAAFNTAAGFVAMQQKNYGQAIKSLEAATQDSPENVLVNSLLGQAYYEQQPRDVSKAIWYLARAVDLAQESKSPNLVQLQKFYGQVYEAQHGSNAGEENVLAQAKSSPTPPSDFSVAPPPHHAATGNQNLDAFYKIEDALVVGGDTAQQNWGQLKGQPLGLVGHVDSVEKGTTPDTYLVRVDITPESQSQEGRYDIVLQESQPDAQYLQPGDPLRFQGTIASYTANSGFVLTLSDAKIDDNVLKAAAAKAKADAQKKAPKRRPRR